MNLKERVAVITGAAGGIGAAIAVGYAKEGAKVVIADILEGKETVDAVKKAGSEAIFEKTDVTKQAQCDAMAKAAEERFGSIDILVNNAGIMPIRPFDKITIKDWDDTIHVNLSGAFYWCSQVIPDMKAGKFGRIINIASISARGGGVVGPHYAA